MHQPDFIFIISTERSNYYNLELSAKFIKVSLSIFSETCQDYLKNHWILTTINLILTD